MKKIAALLAIALAGFSAHATAQTDFPFKPIQLIVGFAAGGGTDMIARGLAQEAKKLLGGEIMVINKAGASATLAVTHVAAAHPDGYTLGVTTNSPLTTAHFFMQALPTDLLERTAALVAVGRLRQALLVRSDSPFHTTKDLVEQARRDPGKISIGIPGAGSKMVLVLEAINLQEKVALNVVPFAGEAPAATALLGGHITALAVSGSVWDRHAASGAMRIVAAMDDDRLDSYPNVPTLIEQGFPYSATSIFYLYGPKGLPAAVTKRLVDAFGEATRTPAYVDLMTKIAVDIKKPLTEEALERFLIEERAQTGRLVDKLGIKKN